VALVRYATAGDIIKRVASEVGLGKVVSPFALVNLDPNYAQLVDLFTSLGQELCHVHQWRQLTVEWLFNTAGENPANYPLPLDFLDMVEQSGWDRTRRFPLNGPLSSQEWQYLKAISVNLSITALFRMDENLLRLFPSPAPIIQIAMEYKSKSWVIPAATSPAASNWNTVGLNGLVAPIQDGDVCLFDDLLLIKGLKRAWRTEKGFDTTKDDEAYEDMLARAKIRTTAAPVLNLAKPRVTTAAEPLIGENNLPITGYGQ
jgi:hypothetical protein